MYTAQYTVLIDGATWGRHDEEIEAESAEEAIKRALEIETVFVEINGKGQVKELLLDYVFDENGEEVLDYAY